MTRRICVWSGPRNISTALMYSFAQRQDTTVVDEPLYAHYLSTTPADQYHPGADEVLTDQENDGAVVVKEVVLGEYDTPVVFFKQMTHHLVNLDWTFMDETINVLLTRDPRDMLPSYAKNVARPTLQDTGYADLVTLLDYLTGRGQVPPVLDSMHVLQNPRRVLARLCDRLEIPFDEAMLTWPAGPRPEDGVWARYWYHTVHQSTGFQPYRPKNTPFPEHLKPLLETCLPYYEQLVPLSIPAGE
jgi:hypothetical protein